MLTSDGQTRQQYPYARIALQLGQKVVKIEEDHETCSLSEFIQFTVFFAEKSWKKYLSIRELLFVDLWSETCLWQMPSVTTKSIQSNHLNMLHFGLNQRIDDIGEVKS